MTEKAPSEEALFQAAIRRKTACARAAYVNAVCGGDDDLRARIMQLLAAHDERQGPLDSRPPGVETPIAANPLTDGIAGARIAPYKLRQ